MDFGAVILRLWPIRKATCFPAFHLAKRLSLVVAVSHQNDTLQVAQLEGQGRHEKAL